MGLAYVFASAVRMVLYDTLSAGFPVPIGIIGWLTSFVTVAAMELEVIFTTLPLEFSPVEGYICTQGLPPAHLALENPAEMLLPVVQLAVPV
jgi:hypothetical protein